MTVDQLSQQVREFANYLEGLLARLDQGAGWCAVFWQRDPDGMRACLGGRELPPWDVVESLLQDLANVYGPDVALQETERAGSLHRAAVVSHDSRPGGREALADRLDKMLHEQRTAAARQAELGRMLTAATTREQADVLRLDLAWANDDQERATARCAELQARLRDLDRRAVAGPAPGAGERAGGTRPGMPRPRETHGGDAGPAATGSAATTASGSPASGASAAARHDTPEGQSGAIDWRAARRAAEGWWAAELDAPAAPGGYDAPGGGSADPGHDFTAPAPDPGTQNPVSDPAGQAGLDGTPVGGLPGQQPAPTTTARAARAAARTLRGARFAGATGGARSAAVPAPGAAAPDPVTQPPVPDRRTDADQPLPGPGPETTALLPEPDPALPDTEDGRAVGEAVATLVRLRGEGRTGEAHALLIEIAYWPATRFPLLAGRMHRAGLGADWATLLWEAASLPIDLLVAAADALVEAGLDDDGQQMLRQGVARPAAEIGGAVLALVAQGRDREVRELLDAYVRVRTPEEAARSVDADPRRLVPLLLAAARSVSDERHWDVLHALRVAGHTV